MTPVSFSKKAARKKSKVAVIMTAMFDANSWLAERGDDVIDNHLKWCEANGFDYYVINSEVLGYSKTGLSVEELMIKYRCKDANTGDARLSSTLGAQKLYALAYAMEKLGYTHVISVDTDSMFFAPFELDFDITENVVTFSECYDLIHYHTVPLILQAIRNGVEYKNLESLPHYTNFGLVHVSKGLFTVDDVDDWFEKSSVEAVNPYTTLATDESFIGYIVVKNGVKVSYFDKVAPPRYGYADANTYNVTATRRHAEKSIRHAHFIGDLDGFLSALPRTATVHGLVPDLVAPQVEEEIEL